MDQTKEYIINSNLINEWNWNKNNDLGLDPNKLTTGSGKNVWWICQNNHEWLASPHNRKKGRGCPYCSNRLVLSGFNDLSTTHPDVSLWWNYDKNQNLLPTQVTHGSTKNVWWTCSVGHEFQQRIYNRTNGSRECPICIQEMQTSFPEQAIYFYLNQLTAAINRYKLFGKEVDVFLPNLNCAIEYDGKYFHNKPQKIINDLQKDNVLNDNNIRLFRIKESSDNHISNNTIFYKHDSGYKYLDWAIKSLIDVIGLNSNLAIDIKRDRSKIYEQYVFSIKNQSLARTFPEIAIQWHPVKNGRLTPENVLPYSDKKVWWLCEYGHEWESKINNRVNGRNCPVCSGKKIVSGINDLATVAPWILDEWDYKQNTIVPTEVSVGSHKKVWWECKVCGYKWESAIYTKTKGHGCPKCANLKKGRKRE